MRILLLPVPSKMLCSQDVCTKWGTGDDRGKCLKTGQSHEESDDHGHGGHEHDGGHEDGMSSMVDGE